MQLDDLWFGRFLFVLLNSSSSPSSSSFLLLLHFLCAFSLFYSFCLSFAAISRRFRFCTIFGSLEFCVYGFIPAILLTGLISAWLLLCNIDSILLNSILGFRNTEIEDETTQPIHTINLCICHTCFVLGYSQFSFDWSQHKA